MGRATAGVIGMKFRGNDQLHGASVVSDQGFVFVVTEGGYAKRTAAHQYRLQNRGGLGIKVAKLSVDLGGRRIITKKKVRVQDLKSVSRLRQVAVPRQVAMYLCKMLVNDSLMSLGVYFHKTHSTILHAYKTIEQKMKEDELLKRQVDLVKRSLET